jgi:ectoine hydroxylase-related dioxygenase (phytanoyl-CoA dioxygenase family)
MLSPQQIETFHRDGFIIVENLLTDEEIDRFVAYEQEPKPEGWRQDLRHHASDEVWRYVAAHPNVTEAVSELIGGQPMVVQTMYMEKKPSGGVAEVGGQGVALHQDLHYLPCEPDTLIACWIAFSDTDAENGGLCVVPGSHKDGLYKTHKNEDDQEHDSWEFDYTMRDRDGKEWIQHMYSFEIEGLDMNRLQKLTVPKGAGVIFSGLTIHGSYANRTKDRVRRAFATHYIREDSWMYRADVQEVTAVE